MVDHTVVVVVVGVSALISITSFVVIGWIIVVVTNTVIVEMEVAVAVV